MKKKKKSRKRIWKVAGLILLFLLIVGVVLFFTVGGTEAGEENYAQMEKATLPLISLEYPEGAGETVLHGYVTSLDNLGMRDTIVPLGADRILSLSVLPYGNPTVSLSYQLRSLDDSEYIDGGKVESFQSGSGGTMETEILFSKLMKNGTEYRLILELDTGERTVTYYSRVLYAEVNYAAELLNFAREFSDATYDREKAATFLVNYIQPDPSASTDDFYYTDIHSKYSMLTYGGLNVIRGKDTGIQITEMEPTQLSLLFRYEIRIYLQDDWRTFYAEEFFSVRYRSEKVYLLDYYRKLDQEFDAESATEENGRIQLGVGDGSIQIKNSENNLYTVFVENREIWSYNTQNNSLNPIFSFRDENDLSERSSYDHHDVQVVKVSNDGSIDYMVYGYMNRGTYEGQVGICFYRYSAENNAARRLFFMPVHQSEQILRMDLGTLAYVNEEDVCYLRYGDGIYSIDLNSGESVGVSLRAYPGCYAMNERGNVVAWEEGSDRTYPERLVILNMDSQTTVVVKAPEDRYVKILDFMEDDIVYGFGSREDSIIEANVDTQQLLQKVIIASTDEKLLIRQEYEAEDFFILTAYVDKTRVILTRGRKNALGELKRMEDDVLLLTQVLSGDSEKSMLMSRNTREQKTEYYIQIGRTTSTDSQFSTVIPRFEVLKRANMIELQHEQSGAYYVYGHGRLLNVESEINKAIAEAYEVFGVVVDDHMNYLWTRGTRDLVKTISIQPFTAVSREDTLSASLRILCAQEGIQLKNVEEALLEGQSPMEIIDGALGEDRALNLYGCTLQQILYFINAGHPVLAVTGDREAVVISGYDTEGVDIYFPESGKTEKVLTGTAEDYFEKLNRSFISYR